MDTIKSADETHVLCDNGQGKKLSMIGDKHIKNAKIVFRGEYMTLNLMVRISSAPNAMIHPPMIIFKHRSRLYPIPELPDSIPDVFYWSSPKGWMECDFARSVSKRDLQSLN